MSSLGWGFLHQTFQCGWQEAVLLFRNVMCGYKASFTSRVCYYCGCFLPFFSAYTQFCVCVDVLVLLEACILQFGVASQCSIIPSPIGPESFAMLYIRLPNVNGNIGKSTSCAYVQVRKGSSRTVRLHSRAALWLSCCAVHEDNSENVRPIGPPPLPLAMLWESHKSPIFHQGCVMYSYFIF